MDQLLCRACALAVRLHKLFISMEQLSLKMKKDVDTSNEKEEKENGKRIEQPRLCTGICGSCGTSGDCQS